MTELSEMLEDLRTLVECESPSDDLAAVARSADVVAQVGTTRLGVAPERISEIFADAANAPTRRRRKSAA